uniref:Uncharacterized protein At2g15730 n=1 Tax=Arabidopsis thaliana TaxID=3702 RepID=Q9ZQE1_ARATH|nr:hypothetical protein [Arabidopsis thaliana]
MGDEHSLIPKQIGVVPSAGFLNVEVFERPCPEPNIQPWDIPYVHYPKPKTYSSSNGEIFSVKDRRANVSTIFETLDKVYNLDWLSSASKNECTSAVGLKWMLNQAEILARYKPLINTSLLIPDLKQVQEMTSKALAYFNTTRHIFLYYEDVVKNRTKLDDVQEFLKVPKLDLKSRQVKIHHGPLSQHVQNWEEVQKTLKGTGFENFLLEDYRR